MLLLALRNLGQAAGGSGVSVPLVPPADLSRRREPRIVIAIIFEVESLYFTKHAGMTNVPGVVIEGCLEDLSSTSQTLSPSEGRAVIGTMSFRVVDVNGAVTDALRDQLVDNFAGVRGHEVRVWEGESDDFTQLTRRETYVVDRLALEDVSYSFGCSDRNRELRQDIFDQASTRLTVSIQDTDDVLLVEDTGDFELFTHTATFTHAPGQTIGYVRIKKTGEIIGYTGTTAGSFTGCQRGLFGTLAQFVEVDPSGDPEQNPELEEFIYLEMPAPQLAYALMTGRVIGQPATGTYLLPSSWHLGVSTEHVNLTQFENIGTDLFDSADLEAGLVLRFTHLEKVDGKRFIEEQLHVVMGTFSPIDQFGKIGLKRMTRLLSDAAAKHSFTSNTIISHSAIEHRQSELINQIVIEWNYNGEQFTRADIFVNNNSIRTYGAARAKRLQIRGLSVVRHTRQTLQRMFDTLTDRYGAPPVTATLSLSGTLAHIEVGDTAVMTLPRLRDFTDTDTFDRAVEVQGVSKNWVTGNVTAQIFGSTVPVDPDEPLNSAPRLADAWYESDGALLSSVLTMSGNAVTANGTITGGTDARTAVFYWPADLTINAGVTVNLDHNVQLRVRGVLTINGTLNGAGRGIAGVTNPYSIGGVFDATPFFSGNWEYQTTAFGSTRGSASLVALNLPTLPLLKQILSIGNIGQQSLPRLAIDVSSGELLGLPSELRGAAGYYGLPVIVRTGSSMEVAAVGGNGGAGGAGLLIVCRGTPILGVNGSISLSGANGSAPAASGLVGSNAVYGGAGAGGAPGACYIIIDGSAPYPDTEGKFTASRGTVPQTGNPVEQIPMPNMPSTPWTGMDPGLNGGSLVSSALFVQWIPTEDALGDSADDVITAPIIIGIDADAAGVVVNLLPPPEDSYDTIEVYAAITNDLSGATLVASGRGGRFPVQREGIFTQWYWARARRGANFSAWSSDALDGNAATGGFPVIPPTTLSNVWTETFDGYTSTADVLREWRCYVNGVEVDADDAPIQILAGGQNGGKLMRVISGSTVRFVARRPVPFDVNALYRCEQRSRRQGSFGSDTVSVGFFSVGADGSTLHEGGTLATGTPTWGLMNGFGSGHVFGTNWFRSFGWIGAAHASAQGVGFGGLSSPTAYANNQNIHPALPVALRKDGSGNAPAYILAVIETVLSVNQEFDYIRVDRLPSADPMLAGIADSNFSTADDEEFWTAYPFQQGVMPELSIGGGEASGNALRFRSVSSSYQLTAYARNPVRLNGNTVTIAFAYKVVDNAANLQATSYIRFSLNGLKNDSAVRRRYVATSTPSVNQDAAMSSLTTNGTWQRTTLTFSNVYSSLLTDADGFQLSVAARGVSATENFDVYIGRVRVLQT